MPRTVRPAVNDDERQFLHFQRAATLRRQISRDATMRGVEAARPSPALGVRHRCCQWPLWGDDRPARFLFCGEATRDGSSFCQAHHAVVWEPPA